MELLEFTFRSGYHFFGMLFILCILCGTLCSIISDLASAYSVRAKAMATVLATQNIRVKMEKAAPPGPPKQNAQDAFFEHPPM